MSVPVELELVIEDGLVLGGVVAFVVLVGLESAVGSLVLPAATVGVIVRTSVSGIGVGEEDAGDG